ncbi:MAG: gluconokinase [Mycobacteriales bacterium]
MAVAPLTIVVMGVSGSGKSTVARAVAERLGWDDVEGDDLHPPSNVEKMRSGHPLTDADRWPWLDRVAAVIAAQATNTVLACSALKRSYRDLLRAGNPGVRFACLVVPEDVLRERLAQRTGHYMSAELLTSQLQALEPLDPDEPGVTVPGSGDPQDAAALIIEALA